MAAKRNYNRLKKKLLQFLTKKSTRGNVPRISDYELSNRPRDSPSNSNPPVIRTDRPDAIGESDDNNTEDYSGEIRLARN
jgi:hypothetical protein